MPFTGALNFIQLVQEFQQILLQPHNILIMFDVESLVDPPMDYHNFLNPCVFLQSEQRFHPTGIGPINLTLLSGVHFRVIIMFCQYFSVSKQSASTLEFTVTLLNAISIGY